MSAIWAAFGSRSPTPGSAADALEAPATAIAHVANAPSSAQANSRPRSVRRRVIRASDDTSIRHSIGGREASLDWKDGVSTHRHDGVRLTYILVTMRAISPTDPAIAETAPDAWESGPLRPRLGDGAVHVWRADLAAVSDHLIEVLSPDERARAERFLKARDGRLWARCHGVLRVLLGRYLDSDPRRLRFATGGTASRR